MKLVIALFIAYSLALCATMYAQVPRHVSYQGLLTTSGGSPAQNGSYKITFSIYDTLAGGLALWSETHDPVDVEKGTFHVILGSVAALNLPFDETYFLEMSVVSGPGISSTVTIGPRSELTSSPYAFRSDSASYARATTIPNGTVVRSLNGLKDQITLKGAGGATVTSNADSLIITASGGGGTGIQGVQNTNNTLDVVDPNGPTATINIKDGGITSTQLAGDPASLYKVTGGAMVSAGGAIGIGTVSPAGRLHIKSADSYADIQLENSGGTPSQWSIQSEGAFGDASLTFYSQTAGLYRMTLAGSGYVGIGTTSPLTPLHVAGTESRLRLESSQDNVWTTTQYAANGREWHTGVGGSNVNNDVKNKFYLYDATAAQFRMAVDENGWVGIGSTSPSSLLHVGSGGAGFGNDLLTVSGLGNTGISVRSGNLGTDATAIRFYRGATQVGFLSAETGSIVKLYNSVAGSGLVVNSAGNVGIGTTTPDDDLHVANHIRVGKDPTYPSVYGEIKHDGGSTGFIINANANGGWADLHFQTDGTTKMFIESGGNVGIGTTTPTTKLQVAGEATVDVLQITGGSDMAEPFGAADAAAIEPGTVLSLDAQNPGKLSVSAVAYDRKVAGIVSGAGGIRPGLMLRQEENAEGVSVPVAIAGRVYCRAEALDFPIEPGDLLTTSDFPGYAMKAADKDRSHGAIIGKAMSRLAKGKGLVLVLVNLQ